MELEINATKIGAIAVNTAATAYPSLPIKNRAAANAKIVIAIINEFR